MHPISLNSVVSATNNQLSADLGGEVAILDLNNGVYYGLNPVGTRIWELIQEPKAVNEIRDTLLEEYEVEPERCEQDLVALLQDLCTNGLVEINEEILF